MYLQYDLDLCQERNGLIMKTNYSILTIFHMYLFMCNHYGSRINDRQRDMSFFSKVLDTIDNALEGFNNSLALAPSSVQVNDHEEDDEEDGDDEYDDDDQEGESSDEDDQGSEGELEKESSKEEDPSASPEAR